MEQQLEELELKVVELRLMKARTQLQIEMSSLMLEKRNFMMIYGTIVALLIVLLTTISGLLFF